MQIEKSEMIELAELVATSVVTALEKKGLIGGTTTNNTVVNKPAHSERSAYSKAEQLLYNYRNFKRIVQERMLEIEDIKKYGVPQSCGSGGERVQASRTNVGIVLPEESVESAIRAVQASVEGTVQALALIDKCMAALKQDPYYKILEMRYFDGRTQEDIALEFGCTQKTISINKSRLVKELALRLFPNQVIDEYMR